MSALNLYLLGPPRMELNDVDIELEARKPAALLYYLAMSDGAQSRDTLATLLWPEHDQSQARNYLRRALWSLKQAGLEESLSVSRESIALKEGFWLDVAAFQEAVDGEQFEESVTIYRQDFLNGFNLPDSPQFDEWQFYQIERLRGVLVQALDRLVQKQIDLAEFDQAIEHARRWLNLDPLREEVHRLLMRLFAYNGQEAAALRQYEECVRLLEEELGVQPETATKELYQAIRDRRLHWVTTPKPGQLIQERYLLEAELGQGGMGMVYQATDTVLQRLVAVKVLSKADPDVENRRRLLAEARAAARLNHPNIVTVYDAGEYHGLPFIVMELLQGATLRAATRPSPDEALKVAQDICSALDHAHKNGIIHRDIKPENVIITTGQTAKLMDFGLAHVSATSRLPDGDDLNDAGTLMGTIAYLAPELILGRPATVQSDLYALGVMLYELTAGRPPFEGDNPAVLLTNHLHAPVVPPSAHNPAISPALDSLVVQLLEKEAALRPPSAAVVGQRLGQIIEPSDSQALVVTEPPSGLLLNRIARGRLVGRVEELTQATQLWLRALSGQAGLLLISGEPGIGKTRLAQAVIAQARLGGASVLSGGCYEFEATTPYLPITEALRDWVQASDREKLDHRLGSTASELARLAPEIEAKLGPLPPNPSLGQEEQRLRLFDNIARFLNNLASENGLLLFVDDLHWADQGSLNLLSYLLRRLSNERVLIVATYREVELDRRHPLSDALVQWNRQRLVERIQLARFTVAETNTMIATLFGQEEVSDEFATAIHGETEGNPFFIEEVAKALVEQGQIYWLGDHWERDELDKLVIPQSIKEAIGRRLNRLTPACIDILHTAAVIGKDFPYELLAAVTNEGEDQILDALEEAVSAQLIRPISGESFIFTHDKIREVLYDEILIVRRNRSHKRIVAALEAGDMGDKEDFVADLAYHAIAAGVLDKGLVYAQQAAEKARDLFANDEALQYYRLAYECALSLNDVAAQAAILEAMGDIYVKKGPLPKALESYREAIDLTRKPEVSAALKTKIGLVYNEINDEQGIAILEEALEELNPDDHPLEVATAFSAQGRFYHYRAEYAAAVELYEKALHLSEPFDDPETLLFIYGYLSGAYQHMVRMEESMAWAQANIALGEKHDYLPAVAVAHEFIAENNVILGRWEQALESARLDRQIGEKIGSAPRMGWGKMCHGNALWGMGRLRPAADELEQALEVADTIGESRLVVLCSLLLAMTYADLGLGQTAFDYLAAAQEEHSRMVELLLNGFAHRVDGYVHLHQGNWQQSADAFQAAIDGLAHTENRDIALESRSHYAEALIKLGEYDEAAAQIEASLQLTQEVGAIHYEAVTYRAQGQLLGKQGDLAEANKALSQAISLAESNNSRLELGRAHLDRAHLYLDAKDYDLAQQDAEKAKAIFSECQAGRDEEKAITLLARLQRA